MSGSSWRPSEIALKLQPRMSSPAYQIIAEDLRSQIQTGALRPGAQLPTETALRDTYGASRNSVREAVKWLIRLGLVETYPGQGTFVRRPIDPLVHTIGPYPAGEVTGRMAEVTSRGTRALFSQPRVEVQEADQLLASELLPEGTQVISRHQECFVDDVRWSLQTAFYPWELVAQGANRLLEAREIEAGTLSYLHDTLGIKMETWRARLAARPANETEAQLLDISPGGTIVEIFQTYYQSSGPFCLTVTVYPSDRNLFQVTAGSVPSITADSVSLAR